MLYFLMETCSIMSTSAMAIELLMNLCDGRWAAHEQAQGPAKRNLDTTNTLIAGLV